MAHNWITRLGLVWAAVALLVLSAAGEPAAAATGSGTQMAQRPPLVVVRALGPVQAGQLRAACRSLLRAYPVRCAVRKGRDLRESWRAWDQQRGQLDARFALELLFRDRDPNALIELTLTGVDIFEAQKPYVFGLASLTDRIALVSLSRIDDDGPRALERRLTRLVLHEVGHALGQPHHDDPSCVMRQDPTVSSLDSAPDHPCEQCHRILAEQSQRLSRPGQPSLDHARGLLLRGEVEESRKVLAEVLHRGTFDVEMLRSFAGLFFEGQQYNEAISVLRYVVKLDPGNAEALVDLGLSYQMRGRAGDYALAIEQLDLALALRPEWERVAEHRHSLLLSP